MPTIITHQTHFHTVDGFSQNMLAPPYGERSFDTRVAIVRELVTQQVKTSMHMAHVQYLKDQGNVSCKISAEQWIQHDRCT